MCCFCYWKSEQILDAAGMNAVSYFEDTNPHLPLFGSADCKKDNPAE